MVGQVIRFIYSAGERAGQSRTVYVYEEENACTIKGYDFDVKAMRTYKDNKRSNVVVLQPGKDYFEVDTECLPSIYGFQDIMDDYEEGGQSAFYDENRDQIIVLKNNVPIYTGSQTGWFSFNKDQKNILFSLYNGKLSLVVRGMNTQPDYKVNDASAEDCLKALTLICNN